MINNFFNLLINLRDFLNSHTLFAVGSLLIFGYFIGKLVSKIKLPEITGYIIAGLLLGKSFTGIITHEMSKSLNVVTEVALGLIAITIGSEFYYKKLKRTGKEVIIITTIQLLLTVFIVTISLWLFKMPLPFALLLGAIASATAPAATVAIVHSLRAKGIFIDYLYGTVALDDAGCVIIFAIIFSLSGNLLGDAHNTNILFHAFAEIFFSLILGFLSGFLIHLLTKKKSISNEISIIFLGLIFLTTSIAIVLHISPLLVNMTAGATLINLSVRNNRLFRILENFSAPIFALFFVIAGTELRPEILLNKSILFLGLIYIISRMIGKYSGVYLGCMISGVKGQMKKYLGFCMFPQAGVAIGLVLLIQTSPVLINLSQENQLVAKFVSDITNIVLFSVLINELIGPPLSKYAIIKGCKMETK